MLVETPSPSVIGGPEFATWRTGAKYVEGAPKSARSHRNIEVDEGTVRILRTGRREQRKLRLLAGEGWNRDPRGVHDARRCRLGSQRCIRPPPPPRRGERHAEALCPRIATHPYDPPARDPQNPRLLAERLGHADVSFTLQVYGRLLPGQQADAAAAVANLVEGRR